MGVLQAEKMAKDKVEEGREVVDARHIIQKLHKAALTKTLVTDHGEQKSKPAVQEAQQEKTSGEPTLKVAWKAVVRSASTAKMAEIAAGQVHSTGRPVDLETQGQLVSPWASLQASRPPEWFQELSEEHIEAFKEIFNLFDTDRGGYIDVDELYEGLKKVDSEVTREEVEATLNLADRDKSGGITFDEFLYLMSHANKQSDEEFFLSGEGENSKLASLTKRVCLFYSAITRFTREEPKPIYHLPHVIKHYTAGARLEGLTSRQLDQNMEMLTHSIEEKYKDSPYSKPLNMPEDPKGKKKHRQRVNSSSKGKSANTKGGPIIVPDGISRPGGGQPAEPQRKLKGWFGQRESSRPPITLQTVVDNMPELRMDLLKRLDAGTSSDEDMLMSVQTADRHGVFTRQETPRQHTPTAPRRKNTKLKKPTVNYRGWRLHRTAKDKVEPPKLWVKDKWHNPTIDDLHGIRKKVQEVFESYYDRIKQASVENSQKHWDTLRADEVVDSKHIEFFKKIFTTYSPFEKDKVVITSQWIKGMAAPKESSPKLAPFTFLV